MCEKDLASLSGVGSPTGFLLEDEPFQFPPIPEPAPVCLTGSQSRGEHSANVPCGGRTKLTPWPLSLLFLVPLRGAEPAGVVLYSDCSNWEPTNNPERTVSPREMHVPCLKLLLQREECK